MPTLAKSLRSQLENTIKTARAAAEQAARVMLEYYGVGEAEPPAHLDDAARETRRKLRAHGRQIGDVLNENDTQTIACLIEETAYEHWHRMLFARFLSENGLLMYPDPDDPIAVTLDECNEMAADEGATNGFELAARFAACMLPQIFRAKSPVFLIKLTPNDQRKLENLLMAIPAEVFTATDSLGWVYQYWQSQRKGEINGAEVKIGSRELPAVTQLFTEQYMVDFLISHEFDKPGYVVGSRKYLDPCCGSGHFLSALFDKLVQLRIAQENLSPREAVDAVLRENLYGLELDQRCIELAAFSLALAAWRYPDLDGTPLGYRPLPRLNLACTGRALIAEKDQWREAAAHKRTWAALNVLRDVYEKAPVLGSLIDPAKYKAFNENDWDLVLAELDRLLEKDETDDDIEIGVAAHGLTLATKLLAQSYDAIFTNPPYLKAGKQCETLRTFCDKYYKDSKADLATVFIERCLEFIKRDGSLNIVVPQNWTFLGSYKKLREKLLIQNQWDILAKLGPGAFEGISGEVVKAALLRITRGGGTAESSPLFAAASNKAAEHVFEGYDVSSEKTAADKARALFAADPVTVNQAAQLNNPDARIAFGEGDTGELMLNAVDSYQGISPADFPRFGRNFWEIININEDWCFWQSTVNNLIQFGGKELVLWLSEVKIKARIEGTAYIRGIESWNKNSIVVSAMRELQSTLGIGAPSNTNVAVLIPRDPAHLAALWCYCSSPEYNAAVREIDQALKVTNATLVKVPFDLARWQAVADVQYPNGLPQPYSDDPTQWIFHGHPCGSVVWDDDAKWTANGELRRDASVLQVAVARLLGYRWPAERDASMELAEAQRAWVNQCADFDSLVDDDGIVCIPAVRGEKAAADRLFDVLKTAYGEAWSNAILSELLAAADCRGKDLESWLRDKFFEQHCKMFQNRPFIWHVWDGLRDGFSALILYHKLDYKRLEALTYTYLGDWIHRQKEAISSGVDGAQEKLLAAESLQARLKLILEGEAPYDIFVRWKPLSEQPKGWHPDLNDGVRLNIRPFLTVEPVGKGKKGAGILRCPFNVKWDKDRGKDVETSPWYDVFHGDRINDYHLKLSEKA